MRPSLIIVVILAVSISLTARAFKMNVDLKSQLRRLREKRSRQCSRDVCNNQRIQHISRLLIDDTSSDIDKAVHPTIQRLNKDLVQSMKDILGAYYGDRHYARFAALENIARVPYFSYTSVLHLYETLGWLRRKEYIKIHFAESWNELHHLLIMESLGGNDRFMDRFVSQHIAFFYYWLVVAAYIANPPVAYDFMKHVETHAYETYDNFIKENEAELRSQAPPAIAVEYYEKGDLSLFDAFQGCNLGATGTKDCPLNETRRPKIKTLYDVFYNIREDELEHAKTMELLEIDSTFQRD